MNLCFAEQKENPLFITYLMQIKRLIYKTGKTEVSDMADLKLRAIYITKFTSEFRRFCEHDYFGNR